MSGLIRNAFPKVSLSGHAAISPALRHFHSITPCSLSVASLSRTSHIVPLQARNSTTISGKESSSTNTTNTTSTTNTNTMATAGKDTSFLDATAARRSYYALENKSTVSDAELTSLASTALLNVPSAFNNQSTRITILVRDEHRQLWDIVSSILLAKIGEERFNSGTAAKMAGFKAAYGTILFWDEAENVAWLQERGGAMYADKANEWLHQSTGMHQYYLWTALEMMGMGANLQHYNPLIDDEVKKTWGLKESWRLSAQMVFGTIKEGTGAKDKVQQVEMADRLKVFGAEDV